MNNFRCKIKFLLAESDFKPKIKSEHMKILNPVLILTCLFTIITSSQEISDNAIGLRLGDSDGFGADISYQRLLDKYSIVFRYYLIADMINGEIMQYFLSSIYRKVSLFLIVNNSLHCAS